MSIKCTHCGGGVQPKLKKIGLVVGGSAIMTPLAGAFGLKAGLLALVVAAWQGNSRAHQLLKLKLHLMKASNEMGSFFYCGSCSRDVSLYEVFRQLTGY